MRRAIKTLITGGVAGAMLAASLLAVGTPAAAAPQNTPDGEILVVTQNLEEAFSMGGNDLANHFEIDNFAQRVKQIVPLVPDVVLLQEVNHETSQLVANRLSARLNQRFVVAVRPIQNTSVEFASKQVHTETAILINSKTMAVEKRGGFISTSYPNSAAVGRVQEKKHAHMLAREKGSDVLVPLMSVHYTNPGNLKTAALSNSYRGKWSRKLKNKMANKYSTDKRKRASIIAGDFNQGRCYKGSPPNCVRSKKNWAAYHKVMVATPHAYRDMLEVAGFWPTGVDLIYGTTDAVRAGRDDAGAFPESNRQKYYSDHIMRWAIVSPQDLP